MNDLCKRSNNDFMRSKTIQRWFIATLSFATLLLAVVFLTRYGQTITPTSIEIVYGSEKQAWLEPLIREYNQSQARIYVQGYPVGSLESIAKTRNGAWLSPCYLANTSFISVRFCSRDRPN